MKTNTIRRMMSAAAFVALSGFIAALSPTKAAAPDRGPTSLDIYEHRVATILQTANSNVAARRLAMERLQFLRWLTRQYSFNLFEYGGHEGLLLFPVQRSDRAYVIIWQGAWPGGRGGDNDTCIICFQRKKDGKDTLVYRVNFTDNPDWQSGKDDQKHPEKQAQIKSLQDYVESHDCHFQRPISRYAKTDLMAQRDYVGYTDDYMNEDLKVFLLSTGEYPDNTFEIEHYSLRQYPITKAKLKQSEFYHKYGLPVSLGELKTLQPSLPEELLEPAPDPFSSCCSVR